MSALARSEVEPGEEYKKKLLKAMEGCKNLEQVEKVLDIWESEIAKRAAGSA